MKSIITLIMLTAFSLAASGQTFEINRAIVENSTIKMKGNITITGDTLLIIDAGGFASEFEVSVVYKINSSAQYLAILPEGANARIRFTLNYPFPDMPGLKPKEKGVLQYEHVDDFNGVSSNITYLLK